MADPSNRFRQSFTYALIASRDVAGKPTLGAQSSAACRHEAERGIVRDDRGADQVYTDIVYTRVALTLNHRVWVPGASTADTNQARRVFKVRPAVDGAGVARFYKVFLG